MMPMPGRLIAGILSLVLLCTACGFQLRNDVELPPQMAKTQMVIGDEYSALARRVRVMLEQSGVQFVNGNEATAVLEIPVNNVVTDVLTIGDNARVREYRISHTVRFRLLDAQGGVLVNWQNLRQAREISFDEQQILAGSREQEYLKKELAETLSRLLIARLESAPLGSD
jgi:LPS-assembly lipoprotein